MNSQNIAFLAGIDPLVGYKSLEIELRKRFEGISHMKKPLNKKQGFLLLVFTNSKYLQDFLSQKKILVWGRYILISPYLTGEARKRKKENLKQRRLFIKEIPAHWNSEKLLKEFSKLGEIQQAYIVDKPNSQSDHNNTKNRLKFGYVITKRKELAQYLTKQAFFQIAGAILRISKHKEISKPFDFDKKKRSKGKSNSQKLLMNNNYGYKMSGYDQYHQKLHANQNRRMLSTAESSYDPYQNKHIQLPHQYQYQHQHKSIPHNYFNYNFQQVPEHQKVYSMESHSNTRQFQGYFVSLHLSHHLLVSVNNNHHGSNLRFNQPQKSMLGRSY